MIHFRLDHRRLVALTVLTILLVSFYAPIMRLGVFAADAWADPDMRYRMKLTFANSASSENLTNFPVLIVLSTTRISNMYNRTSATDIRFYDGSTLLSKETELWNPSGNSYIWVKVPQIDNTNADYIYAYYNSSTSSTNLDDASSVWSGYAMVQHLAETSGTVLTDSTSNHNNGVPNRVTLNYTGKIDGADYYNGTNSYSNITDSSSLNFGTNSFSLSFWFNTTATLSTQDILDKKGGTAGAINAGYKMMIASAAATGYTAALGDGSHNIRLDTGTSVGYGGNVWTMFTVVVNRTSQLMLAYVNGVLNNSASITTIGSVTNTNNVRLGNDTTGLSRGYYGGLDEVRICSSARSASWTYADYISTRDQFITFGSEETPSGTTPLVLTVTSPQNTTYYDTSVTLSGATNLNANITYKLDSQADVSVSNGTQTFSTSIIGLSYGSHAVTVNAVETGNPTNTNSSTVYFSVQPVPWADPACKYRIKLAFSNSASSENLTNFPVLVVLNSARIDYGKTSATDIRFYDWGTLLSKETELWNASGNSYIWVKVPQIDASNKDYIYAYYNCSSSSNLDDAASVWSDYALVQHLDETSGTVLTDSTSNHNDGQPVGVTLNTPGKIEGGDSYDGVTSYANVTDSTSLNFGTNSFSYQFWFKSLSNGTQDIIDKKSGNAGEVYAGFKMTISSVEATGYSVALGDGVGNVRLDTGLEPSRGANVWTMLTVVVNRTEQLMYAYVNGVLRKSLSINSIGSVSNNLNLSLGRGYAAGVWDRNFNGSLDEICIMNGARSASWVNAQYLSMNDGYITYGTEEFYNDAPNKPSNPSPSNGANGVPTSTTLSVTVTDPQGDPMNVSFYQLAPSPPENFTIIVLPDTQYYSASYPAIFDNQTQWAANNAAGMNTVFVTHEGDLIDGYDVASQWNSANHSMSLLDGHIPWAIAPGNHDVNDIGNTTNFNIYFGTSRFTGKTWYGGAYNNDNANSYELFTEGTDKYLIFHIQYDPPDAVLAWANQTIGNYPDRRVIVTTHEYLSGGSRTSIGDNIWTKFVSPHASQIFLVLSGHSSRESKRSDTVNGHTVYQVEADYQGDSNGGNGWLRILQFKPLEDKIYIKTYSPYLNSYETDSDSQFTLDYDMSGMSSTPVLIGTATNVASGGVASTSWNGLSYSTTYQWYAVANDTSGATNQSDTWSFTTGTQTTYTLNVSTAGSGSVDLNNTGPYYFGDVVKLTALPAAGWSFDHWSGDLGGSTSPSNILINGDKSVTATFTENTYTLTTSTDGSGSVNLNNSGPYHYGDIVKLTAIPTIGWSFDHWSGDLGGSSTPTTILIDGNKTVTATFTQNTYTLTVSIDPLGKGSVNLNNSGPYHYGDIVELNAIPSSGWGFSYWTGDLSGSTNPENILMDDNYSVTANFAATAGKPMLSMDPDNRTCRTFGETFTVQITLTNASNVENFDFEIHYNATLLDLASIQWNAWGSGTYTADEINGILTGHTSGSPISGDVTMLTITFNATYYHLWKDESTVSGWRNIQTGTVYIQWANLSYPTGPDLGYVRGGLDQINVGPDFAYTFSPIQGDIDNNGSVNVFDIRTIAAFYDTSNPEYNLTGSGTIDLFDLVVVGSNFGYTYDP